MKVIRKKLILNKKDYYKIHLNIINSILPVKLTSKELEVLAVFMSLEGDIKKDPFGTSGRKIVMSIVGISPGGLGNYLHSLKKKGFINIVNNKLNILNILIPEEKNQFYEFKISKNESNTI